MQGCQHTNDTISRRRIELVDFTPCFIINLFTLINACSPNKYNALITSLDQILHINYTKNTINSEYYTNLISFISFFLSLLLKHVFCIGFVRLDSCKEICDHSQNTDIRIFQDLGYLKLKLFLILVNIHFTEMIYLLFTYIYYAQVQLI